jgi:hypothetical protein
MNATIWMVEIWDEHTGQWAPTVGVTLDRRTGREVEIRRWREDNPGDRFRLVKYQRVEK